MPRLATRFMTGLAALAFHVMPASAQRPDSAAFVIRLGLDTTAVERYIQTGDRIDAVSVSRSPRTTVRRLTLWLAPDGSVARMATGGPTGELREAAAPQAGSIPLAGGFWVPWELALLKAFAASGESTTVTMLAGAQATPIPVRRLAPDRFALANQFDQPMHARLGRDGRLQYLEIQGGGATVERVAWLDTDALASDFAARDAAGRGLGALSPSDSVRASIAGATVTVVYGRPALRGRDLRVLVPFGQLWRTGANNATELRTDRTLRLGALTLEPGRYSLFTLPRADGWTLIVNRQTGQSGLEHDESQDIGRVEMSVQPLPAFVDRFTIVVESAAGGGVLRLQWGGTEARVPFTVVG